MSNNNALFGDSTKRVCDLGKTCITFVLEIFFCGLELDLCVLKVIIYLGI